MAADAIERAADQVAGFADALAPSPTGESTSASLGYVVSLQRRAMACEFEVRMNIAAAGDNRQSAAALRALDLIDSLEAQLTVYRDSSEVMDINRRAATEWVDVESRMFGVLVLADQLCRETQGAFDLTAGPLSRAWGFDRRQGRLPTDDEIAAARTAVGWGNVELDTASNRLRFLQPGVEINLNSIGKGYALDRAGEQLIDDGVHDFLLHGGRSTLLAQGHRAGQLGWTARLRNPLRPQQSIAEFELQGQALSTSGSATQSFILRGQRYGHLIDPRTGWPADQMHSATVVAPTGALADALSTAFYVMGREQVAAYCDKHPEVKAVLVLPGAKAGEVEIAAFNIDKLDL